MRIVICGAGQVGYGIAEKLALEQNDVSIIDSSVDRMNKVRDSLDVRVVFGHGAHPDILAKAGAEQADMVIAVTLHDEINMVVCQVAHSLFKVPTKIARIRDRSYLAAQWSDLFSRENLPIDVIISPEYEVGEAVLRRLSLPGAVESRRFADDQIIALGIVCGPECPILNTSLCELTELFPDLGAVVVGVAREGKILALRGQDRLFDQDIAYVISPMAQLQRTLSIFGHEETEASRVVIAGGGNVGLHVARTLEAGQHKVKIGIIESNRERAEKIADQLKYGVVLHGSALDQSILRQANIDEAEMLVALTNEDEVNILSCVISRQLGSRRTLALINGKTYADFAPALGIDGLVNPRNVTISKILQHVRRGRIRMVHALQDGAAEIIEAVALETSPLLGKPLREVPLASGIRIGAIYRENAVLTPNGAMEILAGDRLVLFALANKVKHVEQMFRVSLDYF